MPPRITVFAYESPWPPHGGYTIRVYDLLRELAQAYTVELWVLHETPLTEEQRQHLGQYASTITELVRRDRSIVDKLRIAVLALRERLPLHAAIFEHTLQAYPKLQAKRPGPEDAVYANLIHFAAPLREAAGPGWVIDQHNDDVQFWQVYTREQRNPLKRLVAGINLRLTEQYAKRVYENAALVISVCEEDAALSQQVAPSARIEAIMNGVRTDELTPKRAGAPGHVLLFTGTSSNRNMQGLRWFLRESYPHVRKIHPDVEFLVAGNFSKRAQRELGDVPGIRFTGWVDDIRPVYDQAAVFVSPFSEAYGSKLKISQALAKGICIAATPAGVRGFPVVDGETALIGETGKELAEKIICALENPDFREQIGAAGRTLAEQQLDWETRLGPRLRDLIHLIYEGRAR